MPRKKAVKTHVVSKYALPYHPTSSSELKALVIVGTAVTRMVESIIRRNAAMVRPMRRAMRGAPVR